MAHEEPELEALLLRLSPQLSSEWIGSPPDEIAQLEHYAERPLTPFYYWFLRKMGRSMGSFRYVTIDFSPATIMASYRKGLATRDSQFFLIGYNSYEMMPIHLFYDLDVPARNDARVINKNAGGYTVQVNFETLREDFAWRALRGFGVETSPVRCEGSFKADGAEVLAEINPLMERLGFKRPVPTGGFCGLFERPDATMVCRGTPKDALANLLFFSLGAEDEGTIRRILGSIATDSSISVKIDEWVPPVP